MQTFTKTGHYSFQRTDNGNQIFYHYTDLTKFLPEEPFIVMFHLSADQSFFHYRLINDVLPSPVIQMFEYLLQMLCFFRGDS